VGISLLSGQRNLLENDFFVFLCVFVRVCFIFSILSNNQKVAKPVYWPGTDGTCECEQVNSSKKSKAVKVFFFYFFFVFLPAE